MLDERGRDVVGSGPEIGGKESVGVGNSLEGSLNEVLGGTGASGRASVHIIDTSELEELLGDEYYVDLFAEIAESEPITEAIDEVTVAVDEAKNEHEVLQAFAEGEER